MTLRQELSDTPADDTLLGVQLLFEGPAPLDLAAVAADVRQLGDVSAATTMLALPGLSRTHGAPVPVAYLASDVAPMDRPPLDDVAASQLWRLPDPAVLDRCTHSSLLVEFMGRALPVRARVMAMAEVAAAAARTVLGVVAVRFTHSDLVLAPYDLVTMADASGDWWEALAFHVRYFRVNDSDTEALFDTYGLYALGLPDVQLHATGVDPGDGTGYVGDVGLYLLAHGDVIEDGSTVAGIDREQRWPAQHEMSLVQPSRVVVDVRAGDQAAGRRD